MLSLQVMQCEEVFLILAFMRHLEHWLVVPSHCMQQHCASLYFPCKSLPSGSEMVWGPGLPAGPEDQRSQY